MLHFANPQKQSIELLKFLPPPILSGQAYVKALKKYNPGYGILGIQFLISASDGCCTCCFAINQ
jgi:hypothetical protein